MMYRRNTSRKSSIMPLIVLLTNSVLFSESRDIQFDRIGIQDGLSQNSVNCIIQDRKGFLWFATEDGLNRFDGREFRIFKPNPDKQWSISYNYIWCLYECTAGYMWIGTNGGGLNRYDPVTERFTLFYADDDGPGRLSSNDVRAIHQDREGNYWIGTYGGGLNKMLGDDHGTVHFIHFRHHPDNPGSLCSDYINCLAEDDRGNIWIGTDNGLTMLAGDEKMKNEPAFLPLQRIPGLEFDLSNNEISALYLDHTGNVWIGTHGGGVHVLHTDSVTNKRKIICYKHSVLKSESLSSDRVNCIFQSPSSAVWIGTEHGLNLFDSENHVIMQYYSDPGDRNSLTNDFIKSIYIDGSGTLWIGTYGGGINTYNPAKNKFYSFSTKQPGPSGSSGDIVWSIYREKMNGRDAVWLGTNSGLVQLFMGDDRKIQKDCITYRTRYGDTTSLSHDIVREITKDSRGNYWIGTWGGGLNRFDPARRRFNQYRYRPDDPYSISSDYVEVIYECSNGEIYVGTRKGLNVFLPGSGSDPHGTFHRFMHDPEDSSSLSCDYIYDICEDSNHNLWVATWGGGINKFDIESGIFTGYRHDIHNRNSLSHDLVLAVHEGADGTLWIGTSGGGLNKFDMKLETFEHYLEDDGLPSNVIYSILEDSNGRLWLSTNKGISKFDPVTTSFTNYDFTDGLQCNEFNGGAGFQDADGMMFFGGLNGIDYFFPDSITDEHILPSVVLTDLLISNKHVPVTLVSEGYSFLRKSINETDTLELSYKHNNFCFAFTAIAFNTPFVEYAVRLDGLDKQWNCIGRQNFATYRNVEPGEYVFHVKAVSRGQSDFGAPRSLFIIIRPPFWKTRLFYFIMICSICVILYCSYQVRVRCITHEKQRLEKEVTERTSELVRKQEVVNNININLIKEIEKRKKVEQVLRKSEDRYRAFVQQSSEGIYRTELKKPISTMLPPEEQVDMFYKYGYLAECNDAMAKMYGYTKAEDIMGKSLMDFHGNPVNTENIRNQIAFIRSHVRKSRVVYSFRG